MLSPFLPSSRSTDPGRSPLPPPPPRPARDADDEDVANAAYVAAFNVAYHSPPAKAARPKPRAAADEPAGAAPPPAPPPLPRNPFAEILANVKLTPRATPRGPS